MREILSTIFLILMSISFSFAQTELKFMEFEYDGVFNKIIFKLTDDSEYAISNIIITEDEFVKSRYEQTSIKALYLETQNYFKSLTGKNVVILEKKGEASNGKLFKLENDRILNYELLRNGLAVLAKKTTKELEKYEKQGFDFNNKDSLTNYIYLLSDYEGRLEEASFLADLYQKEYKKDYVWYLLKERILNRELKFPRKRQEIEEIVDFLKKALELNPNLIDLNYHIAIKYAHNYDKMIKKEIPRDYAFINEHIKYIQNYLRLEKVTAHSGQYFQLAKAFHLKDDFKKAYFYLMKYIENSKKFSIEKYEEKKLGITYLWKRLVRETENISKYDIDDIFILTKDFPVSSKVNVYRELITLIKSGAIEYYEPSEQDEIEIGEIEREYYSSSLKKIKMAKPKITIFLYISLVLLILTFSITIILEIKKRRKIYLYFLDGVLFISLIGIFLYSQALNHKVNSYSDALNRINSSIKAFEEKEKENKQKEEKAIEMAKKHAYWIKNTIEKEKGEIKIIGWKAVEKEDDIYLVSFTYDKGEHKGIGWFFEVQLKANLVRTIIGDKELQKKYGLRDIK